MRLIKIASLFFLFGSLMVTAQNIPDRNEVLKTMILTNKYFMDKWPDVGKTIITNRERPSNIWTRGVYYEGLMALYSIYPKEEYYKYALDWSEFHQWGFRNGNTTRNADDQCAGQTYIDLYNIEPHPERIKNVKVCIDMVVNTPQNDDWSWIDAIQMGMPIFAKLGVLYNDDRYFEKMYDMYMYTKTQFGLNGLYNPKDKLWWRDADFDPPYKEPNGEDCYWSRGNGWVFAALTRVLDIIPDDAPHRNEYQKTFYEMASALVPIQREDGFWNVSLHDPDHFGGKETTGTALFVYGMAWGINNGLLDRNTYLPVVTKAWNAMVKESVHKNGFLGFVQGTGKEPKDGQPVTYDSVPDFEDYGLGCFLMAGSEVYKLE
ncbi:glycoside hydrolase family 88 protein [Saccharicrinis sp. FJH2]|uniref:glycoside hydrolase family 88/105 protein n=1 Tax=unclassified Saccharicrinis TaxID=2646859 RepID=UPI0035D40BDC